MSSSNRAISSNKGLQLTANKLDQGRSSLQTSNTECTLNIHRFPDKRPSWCPVLPASPGRWSACYVWLSVCTRPSPAECCTAHCRQPAAWQAQEDQGWRPGEINKETLHVSREAVESSGLARQEESIETNSGPQILFGDLNESSWIHGKSVKEKKKHFKRKKENCWWGSSSLLRDFTFFWFPSFHSPKSSDVTASDRLHLLFAFGCCE